VAAPAPQLLLSLPVSAYQASVAVVDEAVCVLTPRAAYRLIPGQPQAQLPIPEGAEAVLAGGSVVYWSNGALWRVRFESQAKRVAEAPERPQLLAASERMVAWSARSKAGQTSIRSAEGQLLFSSPNPISALTMRGDRLAFIERLGPRAWRLGQLDTSGDAPRLGHPNATRVPAMLALGNRHVYYYGGLSWGLRAASADLRSEQTLLRHEVCSPLAVADRIYCAQVEGLIELSQGGEKLRWLHKNQGRLITSLAADPSKVVWIQEAAQGHLDVEMLALER
jgi:hypothetical protein